MYKQPSWCAHLVGKVAAADVEGTQVKAVDQLHVHDGLGHTSVKKWGSAMQAGKGVGVCISGESRKANGCQSDLRYEHHLPPYPADRTRDNDKCCRDTCCLLPNCTNHPLLLQLPPPTCSCDRLAGKPSRQACPLPSLSFPSACKNSQPGSPSAGVSKPSRVPEQGVEEDVAPLVAQVDHLPAVHNTNVLPRHHARAVHRALHQAKAVHLSGQAAATAAGRPSDVTISDKAPGQWYNA